MNFTKNICFFKLALYGLIIICLLATSTYAQVKNFTQNEGLPSNEAYTVFMDSKGYLWFATDQGVVRYNGREMKQYNLPDNVVFQIREDKKGRIWFFSQTGRLSYFLNERIYPYQFNSEIEKKVKWILITDAVVKETAKFSLIPGPKVM